MESLGQLNGQERRRYERRPIKIHAKIHSELLPICECEIRDFCDGGLNLVLPNPETLPKSLIQTKPTLSVSFSVNPNGNREALIVNVKPVRFTSTGIGVSFVQSSAKVVQTLQNFVNAGHYQQNTAQFKQPLNSRFKSDIKASCEEAINSTIPNILSLLQNTRLSSERK